MPTSRSGDYEIGLLLRQAHRKAAAAFNAALKPLDIQGRHFGVLMLLHRHGPLSQRDLIEQLGSDKSSMVRTIDELEERGLCRREPSPQDRRANSVHLTSTGRQLLTAARNTAHTAAATLTRSLTRAELTQLCELLRHFIAT